MIAPPELDRSRFLDTLRRDYGVDYRGISHEFREQQLQSLTRRLGVPSLSAVLDGLRCHDISLTDVLNILTVGTTEFFRNPDVFAALQNQVLPKLSDVKSLKIWTPGCSRGKELVSLLVLLDEKCLLDQSQILATDINEHALQAAQDGVFTRQEIQQFTSGYRAVSGRQPASTYFTYAYDQARIASRLMNSVEFRRHDLCAEPSPGNFHIVLCRNVLIYFSRSQQKKILQLLINSIAPGGYLLLGNAERAFGCQPNTDLITVQDQLRLYQKRSND